MELGSAVATSDVGVAAGVGVWPEQAARTIGIARNAQKWSFVIRVLLSFWTEVGDSLQGKNEPQRETFRCSSSLMDLHGRLTSSDSTDLPLVTIT